MMEKVTKELGDFGRYQLFLYALAVVVSFMGGIQANILIFIGYVPKARYQLFLYALAVVLSFMTGIQVNLLIFIAIVPNARCRIPSIDNLTGEADYEAAFSANISGSLLAPFSADLNGYCNYCPGLKEATNNCTEDVWQSCDNGLVYDQTFIHESIGMEYDMACDGVYKLNLVKSAVMFGILVGAGLFGTLADRFGRRITTLVSITGHVVFYFGAIYLFRTNFPILLIVQVLTLTMQHGAYFTTYTVFMELAAGIWRTSLGALFHGAFTVGSLYLAVVVYFFRDWVTIVLVTGIPFIIYVPYFCIYPESIRYAITTGNVDVAVKTLEQAAKMNKVMLDAEQLVHAESESMSKGNGEKASIVDLLFKDVQLAKVTLINFFTWMSVSMLYYGLALNTTDFPGSPLVSYSLLAIADFPGLLLCIPFMERFGRRYTLVVFMGLAGLCVIATILPLPQWLVLTVAVFGKLFTAGAFAVTYNYSAEMFPTVARATGIGWGSCTGRIGSIAAPLIRNLGYYVAGWLPFAIYGGVALIAAVLDIFLPETRGKVLPETIEDGKRFVRNLPLKTRSGTTENGGTKY